MQKLVPIGEAAKFLNVSIDTIRRYDKMGILHSQRPGGKIRYFDVEELKKLKSSKPLISTSQVARRDSWDAEPLKKVGLFLVRLVILAVTILTILFLLFPQQMAHLLTSFM